MEVDKELQKLINRYTNAANDVHTWEGFHKLALERVEEAVKKMKSAQYEADNDLQNLNIKISTFKRVEKDLIAYTGEAVKPTVVMPTDLVVSTDRSL